MAAIFTQMKGDRIGARILGDLGRVNRVGKSRATRLAQGGNVVDVNSERDRMNHFRLIISEYTSRDFNVFPCKLKSIVLRSTDLASLNTDFPA